MQYLVITRDNGTIDWTSVGPLLKQEAEHIWHLQKSGILRNIWFTKTKDAILILEQENEEQVHALLAEFPLIHAKLLDYSVEELHAYTGLERIFDPTERE